MLLVFLRDVIGENYGAYLFEKKARMIIAVKELEKTFAKKENRAK